MISFRFVFLVEYLIDNHKPIAKPFILFLWFMHFQYSIYSSAVFVLAFHFENIEIIVSNKFSKLGLFLDPTGINNISDLSLEIQSNLFLFLHMGIFTICLVSNNLIHRSCEQLFYAPTHFSILKKNQRDVFPAEVVCLIIEL